MFPGRRPAREIIGSVRGSRFHEGASQAGELLDRGIVVTAALHGAHGPLPHRQVQHETEHRPAGEGGIQTRPEQVPLPELEKALLEHMLVDAAQPAVPSGSGRGGRR